MDERTIADALGQKTLEMARHYAKGADLKPKMRGVVRCVRGRTEQTKNKSCQTRHLKVSNLCGTERDERENMMNNNMLEIP